MDRSLRQNAVICYRSRNKNGVVYCNSCVSYDGNHHGHCCGIDVPSGCASNDMQFDNTKHIPLIIAGLPCNGRQFGCNKTCSSCVIIKRKEAFFPQI